MRKRGIAMVIILFFAFSIAIILAFMISSSTNLAAQNKKTLRQLQAYYLAHSGIQHTKVKLRLLPKETYDGFAGISDPKSHPYNDLDSDQHLVLQIKKSSGNYDLFSNDSPPPDDANPYDGSYKLTEFKLDSSHGGMKHVQDGYTMDVTGKVDAGDFKEFTDFIKEQIVISRFTGDVGN